MNEDNIRLGEGDRSVWVIDQTLLPNREEWIELAAREAMFEAIAQLRVRGAPAIGICAAYCLYALAMGYAIEDRTAFLEKLALDARYLDSSRPTAVNLAWALRRMVEAAKEEADVQAILSRLGRECRAIHAEDIAMCRAISEYGLTLVKPGAGILTHCNAGPLATSRYGTALGPILLGQERNMRFRVYSDETRPLLQGARLTSYELNKAGVDVTLICDNMAATVMSLGLVDACFVGCDRVAANGDTANKIGTMGVAVLAKHFGIPLYVLGPTSTIDLACASGRDIPIEQREPDEIRTKFYREPMAPAGVKCFNPAFDVTPAELISGIVTEKGICRAPYMESLRAAKLGK